MQRTCAITNQPFTITDAELKFYERISPTFAGQRFVIPPPTLSPEERLRRRTIHRNEAHFYQNVSAFSKKPLISIYHPDNNVKVVTQDEWNGDSWPIVGDALSYGQAFNPNKTFFDQFNDLQKQIPRANVVALQNENSDYSTGTAYCKNCYLINSSEYCEDCYYGKLFQNCKNCVDCAYVYDSELLYECFNVTKGYNCRYVYNSQDVVDSWFCDNLRGCQNCFLSTNLFGKHYYFLNEPLSEVDYKQKVAEYTSNPTKLAEAKQQFDELRKKRIYKYANIINCENCTGDFLANSKNCTDCYDVTDSEDCTYVQVGVQTKDLLDCSNMYIKPELSYEVLGTIGTYNVHFSLYIFNSSNIWYSQQLFSCKDCFGCVGLRNKQYCIFNKQYSKDDYEREVAKIITIMQQTGEWGEFFPASLSPFGYNETLANEYLPLTEEQALAKGYQWRKEALPKSTQNTAGVLQCSVTGKPYRLMPQETKFYQQLDLPTPTKYPDQRYQERMSLRNSRTLYQRNCAQCAQPIHTTFPSERPEIVYCAECYLSAVV